MTIIKESPLKGVKTGAIATVSIAELPGLNTMDLRVAPGSATQAAIVEILAMTLPEKTGQTTTTTLPGSDLAHALCLAPDWWLIIGYQDADQKLASLLSTDQYHFSATNVSGQRTTIELEGPHAREVLAHLWEQDLRDKSFPVGSVSQGLMAKAPVIVWHVAPQCYRVMVRSSFAEHLWAALTDAAVEWM